MKYSITGELEVMDDLTHEQFLNKFYILLKAYNMHFVGETKEIKKK